MQSYFRLFLRAVNRGQDVIRVAQRKFAGGTLSLLRLNMSLNGWMIGVWHQNLCIYLKKVEIMGRDEMKWVFLLKSSPHDVIVVLEVSLIAGNWQNLWLWITVRTHKVHVVALNLNSFLLGFKFLFALLTWFAFVVIM